VRGVADGVGAKALLNAPTAVALSGSALWLADTGNHRLRRLDVATGASVQACIHHCSPRRAQVSSSQSRVQVSRATQTDRRRQRCSPHRREWPSVQLALSSWQARSRSCQEVQR